MKAEEKQQCLVLSSLTCFCLCGLFLVLVENKHWKAHLRVTVCVHPLIVCVRSMLFSLNSFSICGFRCLFVAEKPHHVAVISFLYTPRQI